MSITISIDETYKMFSTLPIDQLKKVAVGIGPHGMNVSFLTYDAYVPDFSNIGDAAVNPCSWMVSYKRPLTFSRYAFAGFGNVTVTDFASTRLATILADYVKKGVLKVLDNDTNIALTADGILSFFP